MRPCARLLVAAVATLLIVGTAPSGQARAAENDRRPALERALHDLQRHGVAAVAQVATPRTTWRGVAGDARRRPSREAAVTARFRAGSLTKTVVAVLALQQVQRGAWRLDTTIGDVLPRLWPARRGVTVRQLLQHTSGMPDVLTHLLRGTDDPRVLLRRVSRPRSAEQLVRTARRLPWSFAPGSAVRYSSTPYVVLGLMLEQQTGIALPRLMRVRVLQPAGMSSSFLPVHRGLPPGALREYRRVDGRLVDLSGFHPSFFGAAGALVTTVGDLDRFHVALARRRLLPGRLVRAMRRVVVTRGQEDVGLGLMRVPDPCGRGHLFGHDGSAIGTVTHSFASADGRHRVTVALTGYSTSPRAAWEPALQRFARRALGGSCR